ncbi:MAG TPA: DUF2914 domain-containing protein, partial [Candidatus Paceibacterota bacterium]
MRELYKKYERHLTAIAFLLGFILDNLTIQRVDRWFEHIFLMMYIVLSAFLIIVYNAVDLERERTSGISRRFAKIVAWLPVPIQFSFGAILSGSLVFYSRSASLSVSWPFLILLVLFVVCNELVHSRYGRLTLQISGFFIALFLYASFALPVALHTLNATVFVMSGFLSLCITLVLTRFIKWFSRERFKQSRLLLYASLLSLFALFNVLFFSNLIPPLPLAIREIGVFHSISRDASGEYVLHYEPATWYHLRLISPVFHITKDDSLAYVYSSIFAPSKLSTEIVHEWYKKNEQGAWVSQGTVSFPIFGGREGGYRGFTSKKVTPGKWR